MVAAISARVAGFCPSLFGTLSPAIEGLANDISRQFGRISHSRRKDRTGSGGLDRPSKANGAINREMPLGPTAAARRPPTSPFRPALKRSTHLRIAPCLKRWSGNPIIGQARSQMPPSSGLPGTGPASAPSNPVTPTSPATPAPTVPGAPAGALSLCWCGTDAKRACRLLRPRRGSHSSR